MSLAAMTWASDQVTGSPSGKVTLWSIANWANPDTWCAYPSQKSLAEQTEQSADTIQRRIAELEERGFLRRISLRYAGRRSVDFFILKPSRYFNAPVEHIEALVPRGFTVDPRSARDGGGAPDAAADCGNGKPGATLPQTLPQPAADAAATVRQPIEPSNEPLGERERARDPRDEEHPTPAEALEQLRAAWPDFALENRELVLTALSARKASERQLLVDRLPDFLVFHREKRGKAKLPFLHNYVAQENRWQDLPERAKPEPNVADGMLPAFSRAWWWAFIRYVEQNQAMLADARSGTSGWLRRQVDVALRFAGRWPVEPSKREAIDKAAEALTQHPKDGDHARAWRAYYRTLGVEMPIPDQAQWVFLPSTGPPDVARAGGQAEREMAEGV